MISLDDAIRFWVVGGHMLEFDSEVFGDFLPDIGGEIGAPVCDDRFWEAVVRNPMENSF